MARAVSSLARRRTCSRRDPARRVPGVRAVRTQVSARASASTALGERPGLIEGRRPGGVRHVVAFRSGRTSGAPALRVRSAHARPLVQDRVPGVEGCLREHGPRLGDAIGTEERHQPSRERRPAAADTRIALRPDHGRDDCYTGGLSVPKARSGGQGSLVGPSGPRRGPRRHDEGNAKAGDPGSLAAVRSGGSDNVLSGCGRRRARPPAAGCRSAGRRSAGCARRG